MGQGGSGGQHQGGLNQSRISPWLRVLAEPTGSYQDISNTWIAHGYLSSSSYMPSQISVFSEFESSHPSQLNYPASPIYMDRWEPHSIGGSGLVRRD
jgi:hypothetical protein